MEDNFKIVEFDKYCPTCKYKDLAESEDPCNTCLCAGVNLNSHKPVKYKKEDE